VDEDQRTRRRQRDVAGARLVAVFGANEDALLGLFGAFATTSCSDRGPRARRRAPSRTARHRALRADRLLAYDRATARGVVLSYDFAEGPITEGLPRETAESCVRENARGRIFRSRAREYQATVETASRRPSRRGDLFEAVPGQLFAEPCERSPAEVFQRLCRINRPPLWRAEESRRRRILCRPPKCRAFRWPGSKPVRYQAHRARHGWRSADASRSARS